MSLIARIRELIQSCPYIDEFAGFHVDYTAPDVDGFGVFPQGETKISEDMCGDAIWRYNFALNASFFTANDCFRLQNSEFVENFQHWIDNFNRIGIDLGCDKEFVSISSGNGILTSWDEDEQRGTYQIPCNLQYERVI